MRLLLICCGATSATRRSAFPTDEPLLMRDDVSSTRARLATDRRWLRHMAPGQVVVTGPELRCRETAEALGLTPAPDPGPADWNLGAWAGQTLDELLAADPGSAQSWLTDPFFVPPAGEPLTSLLARVSGWLDDVGSSSSTIVVVCTPAVVRAALTHALRAPAATFWRLDPTPLSTVELTGEPGRWSMRL